MTLPKDLSDLYNALKSIVITNNLLKAGLYPLGHDELYKISNQFLGSLHKQLLNQMMLHPQSDLIPELKQDKDIHDQKDAAII